MTAASHETADALQKILQSGEDLIAHASKMTQKSVFDSKTDAELKKYLQQASLIRIRLEIEDQHGDEDIAIWERLPQLQSQMNSVCILLHANASMKKSKEGTNLIPLDEFLVEILNIPLDPEIKKFLGDEKIISFYKNHPMYMRVHNYLQSDTIANVRVMEEIYTPFFLICHYVRDLRILQNDFGSLVKLQSMVSSLLSHLNSYKNGFRRDSIELKEKPSDEPCKTHDEITKELDTLFEALPETATPRLSGNTVSSFSEPIEESNLLPFPSALALFSQVSFAIFLKSEDKAMADHQKKLLSCFLAHILQDDFRAAFLMLLCDRIETMCQLVDEESSSQKPDELPSDFLSPNSRVKTSRLKSCASALLDTLKSEFHTLSSPPAVNHSGLGNLDAVARQKKEEQLFGQAPTEMLSLSSFSLVDATRSPYFSHLREFDKADLPSLLEKEESVIEPLPEIPEPATLMEALNKPPLFRTEEEKAATGNDSKGPTPLIIPPWSFYATLEQRKDQIFAQISKERAESLLTENEK